MSQGVSMSNHGNARDWQTRLRLWAAMAIGLNQLVVMTYYSLGLISGDAMEAYQNALWFYWPLSPLFNAALILHMSLGLWKLFRRNTLKMPPWEATQIGLGMLLPFVLVPYNLAAVFVSVVFQIPQNYVDTVLISFPDMAWRYIAMALIIGAHAQIGVHAVLRLRPWYPRARIIIVAVTTLLPLLAALGYWNGGTHLYDAYQAGKLDPDDMPHLLTAAQKTVLDQVNLYDYLFFVGLYVLLFAGRGLRLVLERKNKTVRIEYPGAHVMVLPATTVLEASRIGGVPHASICGGRGRCTTCRIRVDLGMENLSAVGEREHKALVRIGAGADIRLACQAEGRTGTIKVTPLLRPDTASTTARRETKNSVGRDVELAVMFTDLRGFTALSEQKFPYDVVYILNSYFQAMGQVIESYGGKVDKFLGDGILAYFGLDSDPREACLNAMRAARQMADDLVGVSRELSSVLPQGLSLGIGLHFGDVVLGEVGFHERRQITIIGDTVNTASRLEALNKKANSQMVVSSGVVAKAGLDLTHLPVGRVALRGKTDELRVYVIKDILAELKDGI
jgi:adenylate cyclase